MDLIKNKVLEVIKRTFNVDKLSVEEDELREGALEQWDSLGHLNLLMELEKEFGIKFSLNDIERTRTFHGIVSVIKEKINAGKA